MKFRVVVTCILFSMSCGLANAQEDNAMNAEKAVFAGGCFWCIESVFDGLPGVQSAVSGYTGGKEKDPTYAEVSSGATGHLEAVEVTFDPSQVTYEELLNVFWREIDPTDPGGQFADQGSQYQTAILYADEEQKRTAEESKAKLNASGMFDKPVVTEIRPAETFYPAEEYHQDYSSKQPLHYKMYRAGSGRESFIQNNWNKKPMVCPIPKRLQNPH